MLPNSGRPMRPPLCSSSPQLMGWRATAGLRCKRIGWATSLTNDHTTCAAAQRLIIIDLHTGLGPWGHGELITSSAPGDPPFDRAAALWPDAISMISGDSVSAVLVGDWLAIAAELAPMPRSHRSASSTAPWTVSRCCSRHRAWRRLRISGSPGATSSPPPLSSMSTFVRCPVSPEMLRDSRRRTRRRLGGQRRGGACRRHRRQPRPARVASPGRRSSR